MELVNARDTAAFQNLMNRYQAWAIRYADSLLHDTSLAEDAVQEAFLDIYQSAKDFRPEKSFKAWLFKCVSTRCSKQRHKRRMFNALKLNFKSQPKKKALTPEGRMQQAEYWAHMAEAFENLPPKYRSIAYLRYKNESSIAEIAKTTGLSGGTVRMRLLRARKLMRDFLKTEHGLDFDSLLKEQEGEIA